MAMLWGINMAVELLLEKGVEVMGCGFEGTTVLMKPFLAEEVVISDYGEIFRYPRSQTKAVADAYASDCLRLVLNAVLQRGGDANAVTDADEAGEEPAAKRRKMN
jgi:hypothetical protein